MPSLGAYIGGSPVGLQLPGTAGNNASSPSSSALAITGNIDLRAKCALSDWTPSSVVTIVSRYGNSFPTVISYRLDVGTTATLILTLGDGTAASSATSSASLSVSDGNTIFVRATWRQSDGRVQFFSSADGSVWTQLGTDKTISISAILAGSAPLYIGAYNLGTLGSIHGTIYRVQIRNNILDNGTGIVFDEDFSTVHPASSTCTESSTNAATVTINSTDAKSFNFTFDNTLGDGNGNEAGNWSVNTVPGSTDSAIITANAQDYTAQFSNITLGALKIDDNSGSGDTLNGGGSYGAVPQTTPTVLGLLEIDNLASGGDGVDVIALGNITAVNCIGSSVGIWGWGSGKTITVNGGTLFFNSNPTIPANYTLVRANSGIFHNFTMPPGNAYATLTQSSGKAGDTISGTYSNTWGFVPDGGTCGGVALTNFTASAGAWSGKIPAAAPSGASKTVNVTNSTNAQTIGAGTISVIASTSSRLGIRIGLGM